MPRAKSIERAFILAEHHPGADSIVFPLSRYLAASLKTDSSISVSKDPGSRCRVRALVTLSLPSSDAIYW